MKKIKRSFSLLEVLFALVLASVAMVPLILAPKHQLAETEIAIKSFQLSLARDYALVNGIASIARGKMELENLEDEASEEFTSTVGAASFTVPVQFTVLDKDSNSPPKAALIEIDVDPAASKQKYLTMPVCIMRKK